MLVAAADPRLVSPTASIVGFFQDNVGVIAGTFVVICCTLWMLSMLFGMLGIRRPRSVGPVDHRDDEYDAHVMREHRRNMRS
jgi:hypothetical protein